MPRIPQPPINPQTRRREVHGLVPGVIVVVIGVLMCGFGSLRLTDVEQMDESLVLEPEINLAMAHGGIRDGLKQPPASVGAPALPPELTDANNPNVPEPLIVAPTATGKTRFRIDLSAKAACPT
jgi:hypothetical protein